MNIAFLLIPLSSFLWRIRGGMVEDWTGQRNWMGMNDTVIRAIYAIGMAAAFGALYGWNYHVALLAVMLFVACTIGWFGADVGLLHPTSNQVALISASGLTRGLIIAAATLSLGPVLAGITAGPICWISSHLPKGPKWLVWEEFLFGAALGASLIKFSVGGFPL